jgi:glycosyltransferase involved in cell wall biosynthesis
LARRDGIAALEERGIEVQAVAISPRRLAREVLRAVTAALHREPYVLYRRHDQRPVWTALREQFASDRPDVYYLDHLDSFVFARLRSHVPVVLDLHNIYSQLVQRSAHEAEQVLTRFYLEREARLLQRLEAHAVRSVDVVLAVSEGDAAHFTGLGARAVHVVPNGVDCSAYASLPTAQRTGPPLLLYLGAMSWAPNAHAARFLASVVLPQVRARMPSARLRIIGADPPPEVCALRARPGVEVLGAVPDVTPHLRAAHVLTVPLEAGGGTRLKILEAFAAGVPVVSTPVGCEGLDVMDGTHLMVAPRASLADVTRSLLADPHRARSLAANARVLVRQRYDWQTVGLAAQAAIVGVLTARVSPPAVRKHRGTQPTTGPVRILELRSVRGTGGGPEKTILVGAAQADPQKFDVTVCYVRDERDDAIAIDTRAARLGVKYCEIRERHSFDYRIWPALRQLIQTHAVDIVHAHDYKTDLLALLLARATGITPLATVHGWTGAGRRDQLYYAADKRLLRYFPQVIAVSTSLAGKLRRAGVSPERITTILNGIDHAQFCRDWRREQEARAGLGIAPSAIAIGAVGRLEPVKRFDILLHAVALLREQHPELCLVVAGDGAMRCSLLSLAHRLALGNRCQLLGQRDDVVALHHAFDLFVQSSEYEGTPNAVLEAMAMETPIVATAVGGTGELIEDKIHGRLVPPNDPRALAVAIHETLTDSQATARRVAAARSRVERTLSFDARMRALEAIYDRLMTARRHRA